MHIFKITNETELKTNLNKYIYVRQGKTPENNKPLNCPHLSEAKHGKNFSIIVHSISKRTKL